MRLPAFQYHRPSSTEGAYALLGRLGKEAKVLAGGTALLVDLQQRLLRPEYIVSLNRIPDLQGIESDSQRGLRIGALTTLDSLKKSSLIKDKYDILIQAGEEVGVPALHHMATIGGNLCLNTRCIYYNQSDFWSSVRLPCFKRGGELCYAVSGSNHCLAVYQGDLGTALMVLEAKVKLVRQSGERTIPLSQFFTYQAEIPNCLEPDEILTEVQVPPLPNFSTGAYEKLRIRGSMDFPLVSVAVMLEMKDAAICRKARIVLGAVAPAPVVATKAEEVLNDRTIDQELLEKAAQEAVREAHPVANLSIDAGYRRKMVGVLLKRAIKRALSSARVG